MGTDYHLQDQDNQDHERQSELPFKIWISLLYLCDASSPLDSEEMYKKINKRLLNFNKII